MTKTKTPNTKMPGSRRLFGRTLQWMKAKQAAMDEAHAYKRPGEDSYRSGAVRRGTGAVWHWKKAQQAAAEAARAHPVPGALMYHRAPTAASATAWKWDRSRSEARARAQRWPIGFGRS